MVGCLFVGDRTDPPDISLIAHRLVIRKRPSPTLGRPLVSPGSPALMWRPVGSSAGLANAGVPE